MKVKSIVQYIDESSLEQQIRESSDHIYIDYEENSNPRPIATWSYSRQVGGQAGGQADRQAGRPAGWQTGSWP